MTLIDFLDMTEDEQITWMNTLTFNQKGRLLDQVRMARIAIDFIQHNFDYSAERKIVNQAAVLTSTFYLG